MLTIVEGCDGAGKTEYVTKLTAELSGSVTLLHRSQPKRHPLEEYELDLDWYAPGSGQHIICDRWHWGEMIYGPLYRGESQLSEAGWRHVELYLWAIGALTIVLSPPLEQVEKALAQRGETFLKPEDVPRVWTDYRARYRTQSLSEVRLLEEYPRPAHVTGAILQAGLLEEQAAPLSRFRSLIGSPTASYLLLGERKGSRHLNDHRAAFVPYESTSGRWLLEALPLDFLRAAAIANACEENVQDLWRALDKPVVVPLGREAEKACNEAGVPHVHNVPHPQWVRRFNTRRMIEYGQWIATCAREQIDMEASWLT